MKSLDFLLKLFIITTLIFIGFILSQRYKYQETERIDKEREIAQRSELNNKFDVLQKENDSLKERMQKDQLAFQNQKQSSDYTEILNQLSNRVLELSNRKFVIEIPPTKDSTTPFFLDRIKALENEKKILEESMNLKERTLVNKNVEELNSYKSKIEYYVRLDEYNKSKIEYYVRLDEYNKSKIKQLEQQIARVKPVVVCSPPPALTKSAKKLSKSAKKLKQVDQLN